MFLIFNLKNRFVHNIAIICRFVKLLGKQKTGEVEPLWFFVFGYVV